MGCFAGQFVGFVRRLPLFFLFVMYPFIGNLGFQQYPRSFLPFSREGVERSETEGLELIFICSNHLPALRAVLLLKKEERLRGFA
jgi:hypothetical protein